MGEGTADRTCRYPARDRLTGPPQLAQLRDLTKDAPELQSITVKADGRVSLTVAMRENDVVMVERAR